MEMVQLGDNNQNKYGETSESIMTRSWTFPVYEGATIANRHFITTRVNAYQLPPEAQLPRSPTTRKNENKEVVFNIMGKLDKLPSTMPTSYISRVHHELRTVNKKAYEPVLVSIGPYHYDKRETDLQYMEQHKLRYLDDLIKRREKTKGISRVDQLSEYLEVLEELEDQARRYYEEAVATLKKIPFPEMMLLDGCFIIELFQRATWIDYEHEREIDPVFKANWIAITLQRDLILLENQIPFFVLERLYSIIGDIPDPLALIFMAVMYLPVYNYMPLPQRKCKQDIAAKGIVDLAKKPPFVKLSPTLQSRGLNREKLNHFKHLLDLVRKFMLIEETLEVKDPVPSEQGQGASTETTSLGGKKYTYSATELRESGVKFKGVEKSKFYEITFENGLLEIPVIQIEDDTEMRFRNLIAYEEHGHCAGETIYIGDYMSFMDGLVNTAKDVELLRHVGIIESLMGDDEEMATMFNNMCKNKILMSSYYARIVHKLTDHCRKKRNKWMAKLKRNHCNSPWTIISVIAALVLLILTVTQTVYSVRSYYNA